MSRINLNDCIIFLNTATQIIAEFTNFFQTFPYLFCMQEQRGHPCQTKNSNNPFCSDQTKSLDFFLFQGVSYSSLKQILNNIFYLLHLKTVFDITNTICFYYLFLSFGFTFFSVKFCCVIICFYFCWICISFYNKKVISFCFVFLIILDI